MSLQIHIGKTGRILKGEHIGFLVQIKDDQINTGGFLILCFSDEREKEGFDYWAEDISVVEKIFEESKWVVDWGN
jgi:hypothetical protein